MICRKYLQKEGMKFNVNIRYKILHHIDDKYIIQDIKQKTKHLVEEKILNNHFRYGYCATCHSCQGASIGDQNNHTRMEHKANNATMAVDRNYQV